MELNGTFKDYYVIKMTDGCYWNQPLVGKDGRTENGSRKYRDYYIDNNGEISLQEIADHFGVSKSVIKTHKSNYQYDKVLADIKAYQRKKREEKREEAYQEFIDHDLNNAKTQVTALYTLSQIALIFLGVLPSQKNIEIPPDMDVNKAIKILQGNPQAINKMHSQILRDLEKSGTINDKQKIESENINTNLNVPLKTTDEVLNENADTITRFIERRMHTTDSTTD